MCAASKKSKTQQLKERWKKTASSTGAMTPEFIKGLSPRELGMLGELITIDYFNERGYTLLEQGYRCIEGEADLVLLDELDDVVVMAEVKTRRVALDCTTRVFPEEAVDAQKQRRYRRIASCYLMEHYLAQGDSLRCCGCHHPRRAYRRDRAPVQRVRLAGVDGVRDVCRSGGLHPRRRGDSRHGRGPAAGGVPASRCSAFRVWR
ncbi:MAG: YraN family protein [Collinsella sp.]